MKIHWKTKFLRLNLYFQYRKGMPIEFMLGMNRTEVWSLWGHKEKGNDKGFRWRGKYVWSNTKKDFVEWDDYMEQQILRVFGVPKDYIKSGQDSVVIMMCSRCSRRLMLCACQIQSYGFGHKLGEGNRPTYGVSELINIHNLGLINPMDGLKKPL